MHVDSKSSFLYFIHPFLFENDNFGDYCQMIDHAQWDGRNHPMAVWKRQKFPDDELLRHVSRYLTSLDNSPSKARQWFMSGDALRSVAGGLGGGRRHSQVNWLLITPSREISFQFIGILLTLFQTGIGYITIQASPLENNRKIEDWLDFLHYFRFYQGKRKVSIRASVRVKGNTNNENLKFDPFYPAPAGGILSHPDGKGTLNDILRILFETTLSENNMSRSWKNVFSSSQLIPYVGLFIDDLPEKDIQYLRYKIQNFYHSRQDVHPDLSEIQGENEHFLPYAKQQWFFFSLEGGGFLACNAPSSDFFNTTLPDHLKKQYYLSFMLAITQRFALLKMLNQIDNHWSTGVDLADSNIEELESTFHQLQKDFIDFTARGYFVQAMQSDHYKRHYKKWQDIYLLSQLYQEVDDELTRINDFIKSSREKKSLDAQQLQDSTPIRHGLSSKGFTQNQSFRVGQKLYDRFSILEIIPPTSHSLVIKAQDLILHRFVAIKFPRLDLFDNATILRIQINLEREAQLLAKLDHPNIGKVFDIVSDPIGIIMEWVEGNSLQEIIGENEALSMNDVLKIGIALCEALSYAHHEGVIHRDIKPSNIILTQNQTLKLIDFDVARISNSETISRSVDGSHVYIGTVPYSAPEQFKNPENVGPRADIFSLGCLFYEMLTGELPYKYGNDPSLYPDDRFPEVEPADIPESLYKLVVSLLDEKAAARPSAEVLQVELEKVRDKLMNVSGE